MGLWLNRMDVLWQRVYVAYAGGQYANSLGDIPADLWQAVCDDDATAFELFCSTNNARSAAHETRTKQSGIVTQRIL